VAAISEAESVTEPSPEYDASFARTALRKSRRDRSTSQLTYGSKNIPALDRSPLRCACTMWV